jgi:hypothetical protein
MKLFVERGACGILRGIDPRLQPFRQLWHVFPSIPVIYRFGTMEILTEYMGTWTTQHNIGVLRVARSGLFGHPKVAADIIILPGGRVRIVRFELSRRAGATIAKQALFCWWECAKLGLFDQPIIDHIKGVGSATFGNVDQKVVPVGETRMSFVTDRMGRAIGKDPCILAP